MAKASKVKEPFWPKFKLHTNHELPHIGFTTYAIKDRDTIFSSMDAALQAGYRSFDTAAFYRNEFFIGEALEYFLPKHDLTREDIHITSKISNADSGNKKRVQNAFEKTKADLRSAPDLYLVQFPAAIYMMHKDERNKALRHTAWGEMVHLYDTGKVSSIGVSNFTVAHLQELQKEYHIDIPAVNQVEWNPYCHDTALLEYCNQQSIQLQGYHSLGGRQHSETLQKEPQLKTIAEDHSVSQQQVLLTWSLQRGVAVITESTSTNHIKENIALDFLLSGEEMRVIDSIQSPAEQTKFASHRSHVF